MNFQVDKEILIKSLSIADSIISSKNVHTLLSNCLFNVSLDEIEIVSSDNEIGVRTRLKSSSESEMSFAINPKKLLGIVKELPKGDVLVEVMENYSIVIRSRNLKGHYSLIGTSRGDYPELPDFDEENSIEIDQSLLKDIIRKVIYAASNDNIKPVFNGLYLLSESSERITAVASDSKRLTLFSAKLDSPMNISKGTIIPLKTIHEISRLLSNTGKCRLLLAKNQCFFRINETDIVSRVIDGQFPNYKQVIPQDRKFEISIQTEKLRDSLRRVMVFAREPSYKVMLNFSKDSLLIEVKTSELGEAEEEIQIESNRDESISIAISAQYLLDAIKEVDSFSVVFGMTTPISPVLICPEGNDNHISVIMPIQSKSPQGD